MAELDIKEIYSATYALKNIIRNTDLIASPLMRLGCDIWIKPENLQVTGSFKVRGASYMISQLSDDEKQRGVIACSAGNHAQGVALAAKKYGIKCTICLPQGAPISKVEATRSYGAEICLVPGVYDDAYQRALQLQKENNQTFVHPFDDLQVIAGQGTIGLEIMNELPEADVIIVPVGGGGLISGVAFAAKHINPNVRIIGVQAEGAPSMFNSVRDKHIERLSSVSTIADGIAVKEPGIHTFDLVSRYVDEIVTVTDDEICAAILYLLERHKLIAEGAGAVSVAAAMFCNIPLAGKKTVCLVSGGNVDVTNLNRFINRGLQKNGRLCTLALAINDRPGQLVQISKIIADLGANVTAVMHERTNTFIDVNSCVLRVSMETRDQLHIDAICKAISDHGFTILPE
ncbi:MAG: threonine ammonia-lyase [Bacteroidales bacterium]|nr:threonine ammonia-lyase [Candidatus Liminaster caballi]